MPIEFRINESSKNCQFLSLVIPKRPIPISSGNGEAMITAPTTGASQAKYGVENNL